MPIPPLLVIKGKDTGSPGVYCLKNGATLEQIGNDFGALEASFNDARYKGENRVIVFNGEKYAFQRNVIYGENVGGAGNWGVAYTVATAMSADLHSGLYHILINDQPAIVCGYINTSLAFVGVFTLDGTTWFETGSLTANLSPTSAGSAIVFKDKLFWFVNGSTAKVVVYSPVAGSADSIFFTMDTNNGNADFAIHNNCLFLLHSQGNTGTDVFELRKYQGGAFTLEHTFTGVTMGTLGEAGSGCIFSDGTDLIAITNVANGDQIWRIQNPGEAGQSVTDVTGSVMPAIFQSGGDAETNPSRWSCYVDNTTNPTSPDFYLFRLSGVVGTSNIGQGGSYTTLQYTDTATELAIVNEGPESDFFLVNEKTGGSERIVGTDENVYAELENFDVNSSNQITFDFSVYGTATGLTGTLYYNVDLETPTTTGTLVAVSGGSASISAGTIIGITADDGATLYSATWDASGDGAIPSSSRIGLRLS